MTLPGSSNPKPYTVNPNIGVGLPKSSYSKMGLAFDELVSGTGLQEWSAGPSGQRLGFRILGLGSKVYGLEFRIYKVWRLGFRI